MELQVKVSERTIKVVSPKSLVQANVSVDTLTATFDEAWDGFAVYVVFANGETTIRRLYEDGMAIPWEVLTKGGLLGLTFVGYADEDERLVTRVMANPIRVDRSGLLEGEEPSEATEDILQQLIAAAEQALTAAEKAELAASADSAIKEATAASVAVSNVTLGV